MIFGDRCFIIENDHLVELFSVLMTVLSFFLCEHLVAGKRMRSLKQAGTACRNNKE